MCITNGIGVGQEVIDSAVASSLVARHAAAGQLPWALHYWLAQRQKGAPLPSLQAHQTLLAACRNKGAWKPALHILHGMLASSVSTCARRTTPDSAMF